MIASDGKECENFFEYWIPSAEGNQPNWSITQELKDYEQQILSAEDKIYALESAIYGALVSKIQESIRSIQANSAIVAKLDVLAGFAELALENRYCRPEVNSGLSLEIKAGRHPVIETLMRPGEEYVPNDIMLDKKNQQIIILTGPNMSGKSALLRQTALIVLLAQIGSFVPADSAKFGWFDKIFTRVGASDNISRGESTFMVEMTEVSDILHQATKNSLLILDEIGRGTSTFDGMSIARAVLEFCADPKKLGAKTLFATHYHELTELEGILPGVKNYSISIKKRGDELIFLRKIVPGGADRSYGIEVAKLAGLPNEVVKRANIILKELEQGGAYQAKPREETEQVSLDAIGEAEVLAAIRRAQPDTMSPIEAMQLLYELKQKLS